MANSLENRQMFKERVERERSDIALEKAKRLENARAKKGWKYVDVDSRTQVFVPCDKKGRPTKEGVERINRFKEICGIK